MTRDKVLTFRARQLPQDIDEAEAIQLLLQAFRPKQAVAVRIGSLADSLATCDETRSKTATFTVVPLPACPKDQREKHFIVERSGVDCDFIVDKHFLDFTVLNQAHDDDHLLEYVFISLDLFPPCTRILL